MAEEAFALSPISARAAQPSEEDYAAISEAFMETARGRWFLGEYAKRNRNADTRMVLDAVARIEQSLAAQKEETLQKEAGLDAERQAAAAEASERAVNEAVAGAVAEAITEALAAIRGAVDSAQASAVEALDALALEQKLAPVRKGARVIREIAWRLREIGNDGRICDLIDSQLAVIEAGAGEISSEEAKAGLRAAFASIEARLAELGDEAPPAPFAEAPLSGTAFVAPAPAAEEVAAAAIAETSDAALIEVPAETPAGSEASVAEAAETEVAGPTETAVAGLAEAETVAIADAAVVTDEAADAYDEAMLDLIAQEMGAPDEYETDDTAAMLVEEAHIADLAPAESEIAAAAPEPIAIEPVAEAPVEMAPQPAAVAMPPQVVVEPVPEPAQEVSLGSSLIASGLVRKPIAANDPLAPIRRMSQAEKIAFFS